MDSHRDAESSTREHRSPLVFLCWQSGGAFGYAYQPRRTVLRGFGRRASVARRHRNKARTLKATPVQSVNRTVPGRPNIA